jgi:hypothetical protein
MVKFTKAPNLKKRRGFKQKETKDYIPSPMNFNYLLKINSKSPKSKIV